MYIYIYIGNIKAIQMIIWPPIFKHLWPVKFFYISMLDVYSIVSALQYYSAWYNFNQAIIYLASVPKYRIQVHAY